MSKILTLTATGFVGVVLGAGIGVAAAGDGTPVPFERPAMMETAPMGMGGMDARSMDEMHATMRDQMPAELAERCDEMHAATPSQMTDGMRTRHAQHHPDREG
jgi:hypothetical protein